MSSSKTISQFPPLLTVSPEDLVPIVDISTGITKKTTFADLTASIQLGGAIIGPANNTQFAPGSIRNEHLDPSGEIAWTKINFEGSSFPTGDTFTGTSSFATHAEVADYARTYDLAYLGDTLGQLTYRNKIINGNFSIWQRGTGPFYSNFSSSHVFGNHNLSNPREYGIGVCDRWFWKQITETGSCLVQIDRETSDLPVAYSPHTPAQSKDAIKITVITGESRVNNQFPTGSWFSLIQNIEGQLCENLVNGPMVLSFWAKTLYPFSVSLKTLQSPQYIHTVDITPTTDAWRKYELGVAKMPAAALSSLSLDTNFSLQVIFTLGAGAAYSAGTPGLLIPPLTGSWAFVNTPAQYVNNYGPIAASSILLDLPGGSAAGRTFLLDQVQLEPGTAATQFESVPYADELLKCQRYLATTSEIVEMGIEPTRNVPYMIGKGGLCVNVPYLTDGGAAGIGVPFLQLPSTRWAFPTPLRAPPQFRVFNTAAKYFMSITNRPRWLPYWAHLSASQYGSSLTFPVAPGFDPYVMDADTVTIAQNKPQPNVEYAIDIPSTTGVTVGISCSMNSFDVVGPYFIDALVDSEQYF